MKIMKTGVIAALLASTLLPAAFAHHSFAPHFDRQRVLRVTGIVTRFDSRNPHVYLYLDAVDESGRHREYVCASYGATQLARVGITPQMLAPGTTVTLAGPQSREVPYMCFFETVEFQDGRVFHLDGADSTGATARH